MARLTGLEPATPGVTGRYSNQLSYNRAFLALGDREAVARLTGLEPATPGVTGRYSNQLSYNRSPPPDRCSSVGGYYAGLLSPSSGPDRKVSLFRDGERKKAGRPPAGIFQHFGNAWFLRAAGRWRARAARKMRAWRAWPMRRPPAGIFRLCRKPVPRRGNIRGRGASAEGRRGRRPLPGRFRRGRAFPAERRAGARNRRPRDRRSGSAASPRPCRSPCHRRISRNP